ncbi:hypothetical protein DEU56DRAFT_904998 [Suillus clintonianus]|uniref:uncharacterized protein n=1 Tax=Suillus clintonianus TaxID=1904413 RepID=UPI001B878D1A|nr:uncharacterized protein DEU56DRAFT_904998 [Suillus clintonianus]KAG2118388.1 hypothetical protein DEU56DRAFT_904998 [Suillus clintonianus]
MQTAHAKVDTSPFSDIIGALRNILARAQVIIPNLETPSHIFPNTDHSTVELEGQSVLGVIAERQQQLDAVLREISGLEAVMTDVKHLHQQLVEKKDKITQSMNLHRGLVSALWRFPNEVLSQIFHHCLPDTGSKSSYLLRPSRLKAPMLLIGICRRWRDVATSTPSLWCMLRIDVDVTDWERAASCYDSWLKWSQGLPLSLEFCCFKGGQSTTLRTLLHPYMNKISSLRISFGPSADKHELLLTDLSALEELIISFDASTTLASTSVPQLPSSMRRFTANVVDRLPSLGSLWAHVTDVDIALMSSPVSGLKVLQLCPNLSSLTMKVMIMIQQSQTYEQLTHPTIQSLRIIYTPSRNPLNRSHPLADLLDALSLPNLRTLEGHISYPRVKWPHRKLKAFLARSGCPLESLIFGSEVEMTDEQRAGYTTLIPSLKMGIVEEFESTFFG